MSWPNYRDDLDTDQAGAARPTDKVVVAEDFGFDRSRTVCEAEAVVCPLCRTRSAKRWCPALRHEICAVCCGQKRLAEIDCPSDCTYLVSSRAHPAAVVRRQHEQDLTRLVPAMDGLTALERELLLLLVALVGRRQNDPLQPVRDADVADAAGALAATAETAGRGVIYEHRASSVPAQQLARELQELTDRLAKNQPASFTASVALVLRRIQSLASEAAFLDLAGRIARQVGAPEESSAGGVAVPDQTGPSPIIMP